MAQQTLLQLATKINEKFAETKANYVLIGKMLIEARDRVKRESGERYSFRPWCDNYLRKHDGNKFSFKTIENYIYLAGGEERVLEQRRMQRENLRKIRKRSRGAETSEAVISMFSKTTNPNDQLNILMAAWEYASKDVQEQFLELIGARI